MSWNGFFTAIQWQNIWWRTISGYQTFEEIAKWLNDNGSDYFREAHGVRRLFGRFCHDANVKDDEWVRFFSPETLEDKDLVQHIMDHQFRPINNFAQRAVFFQIFDKHKSVVEVARMLYKEESIVLGCVLVFAARYINERGDGNTLLKIGEDVPNQQRDIETRKVIKTLPSFIEQWESRKNVKMSIEGIRDPRYWAQNPRDIYTNLPEHWKDFPDEKS